MPRHVSQPGHKLCPHGALLLPILVAVIVASAGCAGVIGRGSVTTNAQPPALAITIGSLPSGIVQNAYSQSMSATGGTAPYNWSLSAGSLPVGLTLGSSGQISGTPTSAGTSAFTVKVTDSSAPAQSATASLSITVTAAAQPALTLNPTSVGFGNVADGTTNSQAVQISNTGSATLTVSQGNVSGTGFKISGLTVPLSLSAGQASSFSVQFTPPSTGSMAGSVSFVSNAPNSPATLALSGSGVAATLTLSVTPASVSFGSVNTNTLATQNVTATNTGNSNVTISQITVSGTGFSLSGTGTPVTLSPSQNLTITLSFLPLVAGSATGSLTVVSNASSSPNTVSLTGNGLSAGAPNLTAPNCGLVNDNTNHVPVSWKSFVPPAVGSSYTDPGYCAVMRLTNSVGTGAAAHHYYGTIEPMSAGDSYVLVYSSSGSYRIIGSGAGSVAAGTTAVDSGSMPSMNAHSTIEWDRTADNVFWIAASGNQLKQCSISGINSVSCVTNHTFAEYAGYRISFMDETSMNPNGWLTMVGQNTQGGTIDVFQWNPTTLTKSSTYTTTCTADINSANNGCLHKLISTPNNGIIIQFAGNGTGAEQGNRLWETPYTTPLPHIENSTDHEDCMRDLNNNQVCAFEDFLDNPGPWLGCSNGYRPTIVQVQGTSLGAVLSNFLCAFDMPSEPGWDVSTEDWPTRPWVVYSYQGSSAASPAESCNNSGSYADPTSSNWHLFESEVMLVRVDAQNDFSKIYRLANTHERGKCGSGFWDDPRAGTSFDGKYVIFDSNSPWAATGCGSDSAECTDVFMIGPLF